MTDLTRTSVVTGEVVDEVNNLFTYHPWNEDKIFHGNAVREALSHAYLAILTHVPPCPTRTRALNKIVDARMDANAAITHDGKY